TRRACTGGPASGRCCGQSGGWRSTCGPAATPVTWHTTNDQRPVRALTVSTMSPARTGYAYAIGAYLMWGLFPLYWRLLRPAGPVEILSHRVVWSLVAVALIITVIRGWRRVGALLRQPRIIGLVAPAAPPISVTWGTYSSRV